MDKTTPSRPHNVVVVLGPPGSGKGTLCGAIISKPRMAHFIYHHLSVGDYLRELCKPEAEALRRVNDFDSNMIRSHLRENKLLPADVLLPVIEHKMTTAAPDNTYSSGGATTPVWLIDGTPRNMETAMAFDEKIGKPVKVVILECSRATAKMRFLYRRREEGDDETRFDRRYDEYIENMRAVRDHYRNITETVCVDGGREECVAALANTVSLITIP